MYARSRFSIVLVNNLFSIHNAVPAIRPHKASAGINRKSQTMIEVPFRFLMSVGIAVFATAPRRRRGVAFLHEGFDEAGLPFPICDTDGQFRRQSQWVQAKSGDDDPSAPRAPEPVGRR